MPPLLPEEPPKLVCSAPPHPLPPLPKEAGLLILLPPEWVWLTILPPLPLNVLVPHVPPCHIAGVVLVPEDDTVAGLPPLRNAGLPCGREPVAKCCPPRGIPAGSNLLPPEPPAPTKG